MDFQNFFETLKWSMMINVTIIDYIQMFILTGIIFYLFKTLYKTRAWVLIKGLITIGIIYVIICVTNMTVLRSVMEKLFSVAAIAIVIMFQPDLQKLVEKVGTKNVMNTFGNIIKKHPVTDTWLTDDQIDEIASACQDMGKVKTGALIVMEREIPLKEFIHSGISLKADISSQLLINIFEKNTPLHDGAVIIRNHWIQSATCYLPLSNNSEIDKHLGTRHRAAIGASENTDCVVIVVSEETGKISICEDGKIHHDLNKQQLISMLRKMSVKTTELTTVKEKKPVPLSVQILSPILGVLTCLFMINNSDPVGYRTFRDVSVELLNPTALSDINQSYTIESGDVITVTVKGHRSDLDRLSPSDIIATADLEEMSLTYAVPVSVTVSDNVAGRIEIQPEVHTLKLALENLTQVEIPIELNIVGANVNKLMTVSVVGQKTIKVTGAESVVKTLDKAVVSVDITDKMEDFSETISATIYDKNGALVPQTKLKLNNQVEIVGVAHMTKVIPVKVSLIEQSTDADFYYELIDCQLQSDTVTVAAPKDMIDTIQELELIIVPDDNAEVLSTLMFKLKNYLPEGIVLGPDQEEEFSVAVNMIKYQKVVLPVTEEDISITGTLGNNFEAHITEVDGELVFFVNTSLIAATDISIDMLKPYIVITNANALGSYTAELKTENLDGVSIKSRVTVKYEIVKKEGG